MADFLATMREGLSIGSIFVDDETGKKRARLFFCLHRHLQTEKLLGLNSGSGAIAANPKLSLLAAWPAPALSHLKQKRNRSNEGTWSLQQGPAQGVLYDTRRQDTLER
jgi:hypothetical protein